MPGNVMLVVNPFSGRGFSKFAIGTVISQFCSNGHIVTVYFAGEKTPEQIIYEYAKYHELVVCVGGDGTFSGVASGLLRSGVQIPVGYIPSGTANDIATTLALSRDPAVAVQKIINGKPQPLDIGQFKDKYFTYIAAFGAFTSVAYSTPQNAKRTFGPLAYMFGGLADVAAIKPQHTVIEYDGAVIEGDFIFGGVTNTTSVAGFVRIAPDLVDLADGMFEILLVKQPVILADFLDILASVAGKTYDGDNVQVLHASKIKFTFNEEVAWTIDGEDGGLHGEVEIINCHKAMNIIV